MNEVRGDITATARPEADVASRRSAGRPCVMATRTAPVMDDSSGCAARLKALSDPTRLAVLRRLSAGPANVTELVEAFEVAQNLMSHHLKVLRDADLVVCHREGKCRLYALADGVLGRGAKVLKLGCCDISFHQP